MIIRLKVFIPVVLLIALIVGVAFLKIEGWLKNWIENGISSITDTKTDITALSLSFNESSLKIKRLEIASSEEEFKNAVEFEDIVINFQTLPLLKKRFVIDEFSVKGIAWGTNRRTSGFLPPKPKAPPSWVSKQFDQAFQSLKTEISDLPVSKMLDFEIPRDPREIVNTLNLQSMEAYKHSMTTIEELKSAWAVRFKDLRDLKEYESRIADARKLASNPPKNPQDILAAVQTIKATYDFFDAEKTKAENLVGDVQKDAGKVQTEYDAAKKAFDADLERAKKAVSLEELNVGNLSKILFGPEWVGRAEMVLRYHKLLRKYMASKTAGAGVEVKKPERAKGRDIIFVHERQEPSFVLAKSDFSMKGIEAGDRKIVSQLYQLNLIDLNSAPKLYGKPSSIEVKASFTNSPIGETKFKAFWDYTKETDKDEFSLAVSKIKAESWPIGIPKVFPIRMASGMADSSSNLKFDGDQMSWVSRIQFRDIVWDTKEVPKRGVIAPIMDEVFAQLKGFELEIELKSTEKGLDFHITSDLDKKIKDGVDAGVRKKVAEFQERLTKEVEGRVAQVKEQANKQVAQFQSEVKDRVQTFVQKATSYRDEADGLQKQLKEKAESAATGKIKESLDDVQKNLGNPLKKLKRPF